MAIKWRFDGGKIVDAREANDMSQAVLAKKIGVAQHQVNSWEKGDVKPGPDKITDICNILQCPPRYFFVCSDDDNQNEKA